MKRSQSEKELSQYTRVLKQFFRNAKGVEFVFLFGSAVQGKLRKDSDMDVAAFFQVSPNEIDLKSLQEDMTSVLGRDVDLVQLNNASPILKMQVLRNGELVLCRDRKSLYRFIERAVNEYDDLKQIRKASEENILKGKIYA